MTDADVDADARIDGEWADDCDGMRGADGYSCAVSGRRMRPAG